MRNVHSVSGHCTRFIHDFWKNLKIREKYKNAQTLKNIVIISVRGHLRNSRKRKETANTFTVTPTKGRLLSVSVLF